MPRPITPRVRRIPSLTVPRSLALLFLGSLLVLAASTSADARSAHGGDPWTLCPNAIQPAEREFRLPVNLLTAISLTESGRLNKRLNKVMAWPWTIHAEGRGRYFDDKASAIRAVQLLKKKGVRNIDVGCMQINLYYHPEAFGSLSDAFDPDKNVGYAATFIKRLREQHRSWSRAVGYYHSGNRKFSYPYRKKVMRYWRASNRDKAAAFKPQLPKRPMQSREPEPTEEALLKLPEIPINPEPPGSIRGGTPPRGPSNPFDQGERLDEISRQSRQAIEMARLRHEAERSRHGDQKDRFEKVLEQRREAAEAYKEYLKNLIEKQRAVWKNR